MVEIIFCLPSDVFTKKAFASNVFQTLHNKAEKHQVYLRNTEKKWGVNKKIRWEIRNGNV